MSHGPDRDEAELLVIDADAPSTHPVLNARPARAGRRKGSGRGVGIAVAALVILTAGVAAGSILDPALPNASLDPATASCKPADLDAVPDFNLTVEGSPHLIGGTVGYALTPTGAVGDSNAWQVPPITRPGRVPALVADAILTVGVDDDRCIRYLVAERAPAYLTRPGAEDREAQIDSPVAPASATPVLGSLPEGDWVVRVTAYFETGVGGAAGLVIGQRFFRLEVGDGPFATMAPEPTSIPEPTPEVTPAVPCGDTPGNVDDVRVELLVDGSDPVAGATEGVELREVGVPLGDGFEIVMDGDSCALSWTITILDAETGVVVDEDITLNPDDRPETASQNRWGFAPGLGTYDIVAALHLGPDLDVVRFWRVVGEAFRVPDVVLTGESGATATAIPGCGLTVELSNGYSSFDECGTLDLPDDLPELRVPAWSVVTLEVPGWNLQGWNGQCGHVVPGPGGGSEFEWECSLGSFYDDGVNAPVGPAQFLARPGDRLVQLYISGASDKGIFSTSFWLRVIGQ